MGTKKMVKCLICGAVFEEGIEVCPVCGVGPEHFVPFEEEKKEGKRNTKELFLILGNGAAGLSAAEEIRKRNETCSIVMASNEPFLTYNRPMLTKSMKDGADPEKLAVHPREWYEENHILNLTDKTADRIDPVEKEVWFTDGIRLKYDKLIYALGSECFIPPIEGSNRPEVIAVRRIADLIKLNSFLPKVDDAVVIGGGVLGLEAAWELKKLGKKVTVLEAGPYLMGRQLDEASSRLLEGLIQEQGIDVKTGAQTEAVEGESHVTGVRLADHTVIPAQLVIISAGVRANIKVAQTAGIKTEKAVVVNEKMETSVTDIYACGDCAQYKGVNYAVWLQALQMGKTAGANAAGEVCAYQLKAPALTFMGMGTSLYAAGDNGKNPELEYETKAYSDPEKRQYEKYYYADGRMTGAILIGNLGKMKEIRL